MKYHAIIINPSDYSHSQCFSAVATAVSDALRELDAYDLDGTPIIFGAHLDKSIPEDAIIYNTEQVFSWDYLQTLKRHRVWDYSGNNIEMLAEKGVKGELCPVAYMPGMTIGDGLNADTQDIDVLMYGSQNHRRVKIHNDLVRAGVKARFVFDVYGNSLNEIIARSKIVLNVHFYEEGVHEIFRTSHLMANKKVVVSEKGKDRVLENSYYHAIVFAEYDNIVEQCLHLLALDGIDRKEIGDKGFDIFSKTSMVDSLRGLI